MFQCYAFSSSHHLLPPLNPQVCYLCLHPYSCSMWVLTVASWSTCRFIRDRNVIWYSYLFKNFPQFVVIHIVKGFSVADIDEADVFLEYPCFLYDLTKIGSLFSGSSAFSKTSLHIWKFTVHVLLKLVWVAFLFSRDLPNPGIEPRSPSLQADSLCWATREAHKWLNFMFISDCVSTYETTTLQLFLLSEILIGKLIQEKVFAWHY